MIETSILSFHEPGAWNYSDRIQRKYTNDYNPKFERTHDATIVRADEDEDEGEKSNNDRTISL